MEKKGTQAAKIVEEWKGVAVYNRNTKSCAAPDHRGINIMVRFSIMVGFILATSWIIVVEIFIYIPVLSESSNTSVYKYSTANKKGTSNKGSEWIYKNYCITEPI